MAAPGALLAPLGPCLALPGRSWEPFSSPRGLLWDLFGSLFPTPLEKHENLDFRRQLQRKSRFGRPRGVQNRAPKAPNGSEIALARVLAALGAHLARSWRLLAASWRFWGLLGVSWAALEAILAQKGNLAIMEREARSQRELQALQAANNKAAKHQESVLVKLCVLVKLRGRAPRPRSASWRGVAWNASRAGGLNASLQAEQNGTKMA